MNATKQLTLKEWCVSQWNDITVADEFYQYLQTVKAEELEERKILLSMYHNIEEADCVFRYLNDDIEALIDYKEFKKKELAARISKLTGIKQ